MDLCSLTLLVLTLVLAAHSPLPAHSFFFSLPLPLPHLIPTTSSSLSSSHPSPSPSPSPSHSPPKQLMSDTTGLQLSPPREFFHYPPNDSRHRAHQHRPGVVAEPREQKLNLGKTIGLTFAGAALVLQVALGAFLVYKRFQLRKVERGGAASSYASSA